MADNPLEKIDNDLDTAKQYVKQAGQRANHAGDSDGVKKCDELIEKVDETKEDFKKKGR